MKKERDAGGSVTMQTGYPMPMGMMPMPGTLPVTGFPMAPGIPINQGMISPTMMNASVSAFDTNNGISTVQTVTTVEQLQAQLNNLDRRVTRLENMMNDTKNNSFSNNTYNDSNYPMM